MNDHPRPATWRAAPATWARRYAGLLIVVALLVIVILIAPTTAP